MVSPKDEECRGVAPQSAAQYTPR
ncbi:hypothetical protein CNYM01_06435 [Colletotrichum nymphaeae SA-01]|uniref:Uncharacterized protein n=1 Tax=Colletotrichum nymphaeae SA-01 TaxID=1460502 RepID=A0A135SBW5_9PEZI|nr:hypothetical protein CNYM01_06435 [Colletotrichum nymphaeae SA-01]